MSRTTREQRIKDEYGITRQDVIKFYARKNRQGRPVLCTASPNDPDKRSENKVIYDGEENARGAAIALELLGARPMTWYVCHRSNRRHHLHLTTKDKAE